MDLLLVLTAKQIITCLRSQKNELLFGSNATLIKTDVIYPLTGVLCLSSGPQGGRHVDYVADQLVSKLIEVVKKKNKAGVAIKPFQVQSSRCEVGWS